MNLSQIVCSLDNAKRLKELGVNSPSLFYWIEVDGNWGFIRNSEGEEGHEWKPDDESVPAPNASELMEILPVSILRDGFVRFLHIRKYEDEYAASYDHYDECVTVCEESESLADALALLLIHLIEQGYYEPK